MGDASDIEGLLTAHAALEKKRRLWGVLKMAFTLASAFAGAGWTAHGYLNQLATKDDVAALLRGQQEQLRELDSKLAMLTTRVTVVETQLGDMRRPLKVER